MVAMLQSASALSTFAKRCVANEQPRRVGSFNLDSVEISVSVFVSGIVAAMLRMDGRIRAKHKLEESLRRKL